MQKIFKSTRYYIHEKEINDKIKKLLRNLNTKSKIAFYCEKHQLYAKFQELLVETLGNSQAKTFKSTTILKDITTVEEMIEIIDKQHKELNHRGIDETYKELKNIYYHPNLKKVITRYNNSCLICLQAKHDRHEEKYKFEKSEIPSRPNVIIHGDLYIAEKQIFFTFLDKFTKHLTAIPITDRNSITFIETLKFRHSIFGKPEKYILDNEFNNTFMVEYFRENNINVHFTSALIKTGNADIERAHGTINEHLRLLKVQNNRENIKERVIKAVTFYNQSIHSTINSKPVDFVNTNISKDSFQTIKNSMEKKQQDSIDRINKKRKDKPKFEEDKQILIKAEKVRKSDPKYKLMNMKLRSGKILDNRNRNIHPARIKRNFKNQKI